ncbi:MAG: inorganic phosphate transporter [Planctomycetota bacterium]
MFIYLSSGLFLGWSLGANDAANVFGTAVGTRMLRFRTAAVLGAICVVIGAVLEGSGPSATLGKLGAVDAIGGAFTVALAAAISVTLMTRLKIPVSTSQAIVGAIVGWNLFSGHSTDYDTLLRIVATWVVCPGLAALFATGIYYVVRALLEKCKIHLLTLDAYTRMGLIVVGMAGAYSLGANNIANVMGVFVPAAPLPDIQITSGLAITGTQLLFLLGGIAISVGIFTYSHHVMETVGRDLFRLSPITAFIVVLSHSMVLYVFASEGLRDALTSLGLPSIPLVPVSSSQAIVGAILGIALAKGARNIDWRVLGGIASGWVTTPFLAGGVSYVTLFIMQNVFDVVVAQ